MTHTITFFQMAKLNLYCFIEYFSGKAQHTVIVRVVRPLLYKMEIQYTVLVMIVIAYCIEFFKKYKTKPNAPL